MGESQWFSGGRGRAIRFSQSTSHWSQPRSKLTKYIFNYGDKVLLMSATIIDHKHFAKTLGITDYKYIEVDSTFEAEKAPIYINTKHKINHYNLKENIT